MESHQSDSDGLEHTEVRSIEGEISAGAALERGVAVAAELHLRGASPSTVKRQEGTPVSAITTDIGRIHLDGVVDVPLPQ